MCLQIMFSNFPLTDKPSRCTSIFVYFGQIFEGNTHYDTPELRHFEEIEAQYVRLYPERWSPAGIGMRVEILGCDLPGRTFCCCLCDRESCYI